MKKTLVLILGAVIAANLLVAVAKSASEILPPVAAPVPMPADDGTLETAQLRLGIAWGNLCGAIGRFIPRTQSAPPVSSPSERCRDFRPRDEIPAAAWNQALPGWGFPH